MVDYKEKPLGQVDMPKLQELAKEKTLDILLLNDKPTIVQLLNYWRVLYKAGVHIRDSMERKEHHNIKTITINSKILKHDLSVKLGKVQQLLDKGNKVTVEVTAKDSSNTDQVVQARQIAKNVREQFAKVQSCEVDVENTEAGATVSLDLPIANLQKSELDTFLEDKEVIRKAGYAPKPSKPRKEGKALPLFQEIHFQPPKPTVAEAQEEKDSLELLEKQEEARREFAEYQKKLEHEKKVKRRMGREPVISKTQAKFT